MSALIRIGTGTTVKWGSGTGTGAASGILTVTGGTLKNGNEIIGILNTDGIPDGIIGVPTFTEASVEGYSSSATASPSVATSMTLNGVTCILDSSEILWEQKGIVKCRLSGKALPG